MVIAQRSTGPPARTTASPIRSEPSLPLVLLVRPAAGEREEHAEAAPVDRPPGLLPEPLERAVGDERHRRLLNVAVLFRPDDPDRMAGHRR